MAHRTCSIEGCDAAHIARGWCKIHYRRWCRTGSPINSKKSLHQRFWSKVEIVDGCWEWNAAICSGGYGVFRDGKMEGAHRVAFRLTFGEIPDGMHVLHHCDNPPCCNPAHLFLGTIADNNADKAQKGRAPRTIGWAKLSDDQVRCVRARLGEGANQSVVAAEFGVSQSTVSRIANRRAWVDA